jgi:hypothetical protein
MISKGIIRHTDGRVEQGEFKDGLMVKGVVLYPTVDGVDRYVGEMHKRMFHGRGVYTFSNGVVLDGMWENGSFISTHVPYHKNALSLYKVNQEESPTCWIYAWTRIMMNLIKKYVALDSSECYQHFHIFSHSYIQDFIKDPESIYDMLPCDDEAKEEFVLFCYIYYRIEYSRIEGKFQLNQHQIHQIKKMCNELFNKQKIHSFLNEKYTKICNHVMNQFYRRIPAESYFFIKSLLPNQLISILDQGLYINIVVNGYILFKNNNTDDPSYFLNKPIVKETVGHSMVIREYTYHPELKQPVFKIINSHGRTNEFFHVPLSFLQMNQNEVQLYYISHVYQDKKYIAPVVPVPVPPIVRVPVVPVAICPKGKDVHPHYPLDKKRCLVSCKDGFERSKETMRCIRKSVLKSSPRKSPRKSPRTSPRTSPRKSPRKSPRTSPRKSPRKSSPVNKCPDGKEPHPNDPKKCLVICKDGLLRNPDTMRCIKKK